MNWRSRATTRSHRLGTDWEPVLCGRAFAGVEGFVGSVAARSGHRTSRLIESSFGPRDLSPYRGTGSGCAVHWPAFSAEGLALKGREVRERTSGTRPRRQFRGIRAM